MCSTWKKCGTGDVCKVLIFFRSKIFLPTCPLRWFWILGKQVSDQYSLSPSDCCASPYSGAAFEIGKYPDFISSVLEPKELSCKLLVVTGHISCPNIRHFFHRKKLQFHYLSQFVTSDDSLTPSQSRKYHWASLLTYAAVLRTGEMLQGVIVLTDWKKKACISASPSPVSFRPKNAMAWATFSRTTITSNPPA